MSQSKVGTSRLVAARPLPALEEIRRGQSERIPYDRRIMTTKTDIEGRPEIETLVNRFYAKVRRDELLGPIFDDVAKVDWNEHLPKLYAFWQTVLFGDGGFRGNPLAVHKQLVAETTMDWPRFERWLALFGGTVDELYAGERATHIKSAADDMAHVIYSRIHNVVDPRFDPAKLTPEQKARYSKYQAKPPDESSKGN